MSDMYNTTIPELMLNTMRNADAKQAERLFDDAEFCGRKLMEGIMTTGRLLSGMGDGLDPQMDELRSLGDSLAVMAELATGFYDVVDMYRCRQLEGNLPQLRGAIR